MTRWEGCEKKNAVLFIFYFLICSSLFIGFVIIVLKDVKCSGNWMWAAKLPGEGVRLWDACKAMCEVMGQLGVAIDGGKDSLSMAARVGKETVKAPGTSCSGSTTLK